MNEWILVQDKMPEFGKKYLFGYLEITILVI